jgi:hypothetical protein
MRIDTGSHSIVIPSKYCKGCMMKYTFDQKKSVSFRINKKNIIKCYGDGCYYGNFV